MFDTVNFRLVGGIGGNFIKGILPYIENVGEHLYNRELTITGDIGSLKVTASQQIFKLNGGSLCKWFLGDNFQTMGRKETKQAIEKLSDTIHLPIEKAEVTRLDIGQNFIMKHPPNVYFNHLGQLSYTKRLQEPNGLYYATTSNRLCFYDKIRECKDKQEIPALYRNSNVLRYEYRLINRVAKHFNRQNLIAKTLYNSRFYISLVDEWKNKYDNIQKQKAMSLNNEIKTKKQLYKTAVCLVIEKFGGLVNVLEDIKEKQAKGILTRQQAFDLKQAFQEATGIDDFITVEDETIQELTQKIEESAKYYL